MSFFGKVRNAFNLSREVFEDAQYMRRSRNVQEMRDRLEKIKARDL